MECAVRRRYWESGVGELVMVWKWARPRERWASFVDAFGDLGELGEGSIHLNN